MLLFLFLGRINIMQMLRKRSSLLALGMLLMVLVSACGSATGSGSPADVLQKSSQAMQKLTSAHFALNLTATANLGSLLSASYDTTSTPTGVTDITVTAKASGQSQFPDQTALDLQLRLPTASQDTQISTVLKDKKVYYKGSDEQWYVTDLKDDGNFQDSLFSSAQISNYDKLLGLADKAKVTDHGVENRNGENLRHITLAFDKTALNDVLDSLGLNGALDTEQQQSASAFLDMLKVNVLSFDTWIDETTSYIHHMDLHLDLAVDMGGIATTVAQFGGDKMGSSLSFPDNIALKMDLGVDLSKFNEPVKIETPANALPADHLPSFFKMH
jgi:hypothetical protein